MCFGFEGFDEVRAHDWIAAARRFRNTLRKGQEASREIVFKAIREIVAMNSAAKTRANIMTDDWSEDSLAQIEGKLVQGFVVASRPAAPDSMNIEVRIDVVDDFARAHVGLIGLSQETGIHPIGLRRRLDAAGIRPIDDPERLRARIYRRADLEALSLS